MSRSYSPQHLPQSRRRRSSTFRLWDLPVEIRLLILEFSLPSINDVSRHWPTPIPALLRTSRQFNADTKMVMKRWSPIHYVPDPTFLSMIPHPGAVQVEHICLSMFHEARIGVLRSGPNTQTPADDHQDLVLNWMNYIDQLPAFPSIKTVSIDATPAPGWLRYEKPDWISNIVTDKSVAGRFVFEHTVAIADLITTVVGFYNSLNRPVEVDLAGLYGYRSRMFPRHVESRLFMNGLNTDLQFTGIILSDQHHRGPQMTIERGISELYSTKSIPAEEYRRQKSQIMSDKRRLLQYNYSPTTEFLFENCYADDEFWTMQQLERLTDFTLDGEYGDGGPRYIYIQIPDFAHGSFVCSLARDLNLATTPRTTWRKKEIRIYRRTHKNRTRTATKESSSSSLLNFMIMSVAVVLFVGILNNDTRRRR